MVNYPVIINGTMLSSSTANNQYVYRFPSGNVNFKDSSVAVSSISMYYSWFNITASNGNNVFTFTFPGAAGSPYTVTLPNGFYSIDTLNNYLQQFCITNGLYLVNGSGQYVYYLEFITNSTYYSVQLNVYPVPTSLPSGYTNPGSMAFPSSSTTPTVTILANNFRYVIGFQAGTYPSAPAAVTTSVLSTFTPQVTPVNNIVLACTLLNNRYSNPPNVIYSFAPNVSFGELINSVPNQLAFIPIQDGQYADFQIQFLDQNFNALQLNDTNIIVQLIIDSPISK